MTDLNPADIMAEHEGAHQCFRGIYLTMQGQVCWPYRLAAELAVMREREQRVVALMKRSIKPGTHPTMIDWRDLAAALAGEGATEPKCTRDQDCPVHTGAH